MSSQPDGLRKVCYRMGVEAASWRICMSEEDTRKLSTYDRATDTVIVCWYVSKPVSPAVAAVVEE